MKFLPNNIPAKEGSRLNSFSRYFGPNAANPPTTKESSVTFITVPMYVGLVNKT